MVNTKVVSERAMSAGLQRRLRLDLVFLFLLSLFLVSACSTSDHSAADFSKAQELRKNAQIAAAQGDTASALEDIDQVQVLEPRVSRLPGLTPPSMSGPEHRAIAPASGPVTCNNIGINRFSCF